MAVLPSVRVAPAGVEPATARVRTGSSAVVELRSREVWPAGVEPAAPRVSGGRSTGLSYGHIDGRGWNRTSGFLCVRQALWPAELLAQGRQGWSRTSGLFRIREVLFRLSYRRGSSGRTGKAGTASLNGIASDASMVPGQGLEPRPPRSERDVLPLDDPGPMCVPMARPDECRTMFFKPLANPSALDRRPPVALPGCRRPTWRSFGARSPCGRWEMRTLKHALIFLRTFQRRAPRIFLSQAGPRFVLELLQAEHHLCFRRDLPPPETTKATSWVALDWLDMRLGD